MSDHFFSSFYLHKKHKQLFLTEPRTAFIQYKNFRIDLTTGKREESGVVTFFEFLNGIDPVEEKEKPIVVHLFYELGYSCVDLITRLDENVPLAIYVEYDKAEEREIFHGENKKLSLEALSQLSFEKYHKQFNQVYRNLLDGETYQLNLTTPFYLRPKEDLSPLDYIQRLWQDSFKVGAYAHATYVEALDKLYLSNSPECLFQINHTEGKDWIVTMPIKGTEKVHGEDWSRSWLLLKNSAKNQSELYMITDLMRNDLTRLTGNSSEVVYKKYPLHVPGLIHQFSVVRSLFDSKKSLAEVVRALFPGGSITGAPKKNTMKLISQIENYKRGFYCGSTILLYKKIKTASINIRSCEIDYTQQEIKYGAGGGITLQSQALEEYEETLDKFKSFLLLVK